MKLVKLSLATIMGLSTSVFAADTLGDAFKEGKVNGAVQAYYWDRDTSSGDAGIMNLGLDLSYETATFYNFGLKSTFQSSASPFANNDAKSAFSGDMYGSGAQLSELYLSYSLGKTRAQIGRMYFATPLIYGSGSRMNREAFEGALVTNSDIPNTKITLGYVQKMQNRTDDNGDIGEFTNDFTWQGEVSHGGYTAVVENTSIPNVNLTAAYLKAEDLMEVSYLEAAFNRGIVGLATQYYYSDYDGNDETYLFGLKGSINLGKLSIVAAYTTTGDSYVYAGLGNGADYAYTGSPILSDTYAKDSNAYKLGASYEVTPALNVGINYILDNQDTVDYSYTSATVDYTLSGALEGINVAVLYDEAGKDKDDRELRINVNYPF